MIVYVALQPSTRAVEVSIKHLAQSRRRVKTRHRARAIQRMPHVVEPDDFSICRIKKRNVEAIKVKRIVGRASRVSFSLGEYVLRPERQSLRFDHSEQDSINA